MNLNDINKKLKDKENAYDYEDFLKNMKDNDILLPQNYYEEKEEEDN